MKHTLQLARIKDWSYFRDVFLVCGSNDELKKFCDKRRRKDENWPEWNTASSGKWCCAVENGYPTHYVIVSTDHNSAWRDSILAHEVLHLAFQVLKSAGIQYCEASEEAFTYYFQMMFSQCLKVIRKQEDARRHA